MQALNVATCVRELLACCRRRESVPDLQQFAASLGRFGRADDAMPEPDTEEPIFVLATGWRTGSTLVQRILSTDRDLFLWGEPFGRMALIPRLADALSAISPSWPTAEMGTSEVVPAQHRIDRWTANLFPPPGRLRAGLRHLLQDWLAVPARAQGCRRWGFKEVRLDAREGALLSWLYPRAHVVVVTRDPRQAYRSAVGRGRRVNFIARWPDRRVESAAAFSRHWNRLAGSWRHTAGAPTILRYEDIVEERVDWGALSAHLRLALDPQQALRVRVGGTASRALTWYERRIIEREAASGMAMFGYSPATTVIRAKSSFMSAASCEPEV